MPMKCHFGTSWRKFYGGGVIFSWIHKTIMAWYEYGVIDNFYEGIAPSDQFVKLSAWKTNGKLLANKAWGYYVLLYCNSYRKCSRYSLAFFYQKSTIVSTLDCENLIRILLVLQHKMQYQGILNTFHWRLWTTVKWKEKI